MSPAIARALLALLPLVLVGQRASAFDPPESSVRRGRQVFMSASCPRCHTVAGTPAAGTSGPDLTRLASRRTLADGRLPNTRGNLGRWVIDPGRIEPGVRMPGTTMTPDDVHALLDYLQSLK